MSDNVTELSDVIAWNGTIHGNPHYAFDTYSITFDPEEDAVTCHITGHSNLTNLLV